MNIVKLRFPKVNRFGMPYATNPVQEALRVCGERSVAHAEHCGWPFASPSRVPGDPATPEAATEKAREQSHEALH